MFCSIDYCLDFFGSIHTCMYEKPVRPTLPLSTHLVMHFNWASKVNRVCCSSFGIREAIKKNPLNMRSWSKLHFLYKLKHICASISRLSPLICWNKLCPPFALFCSNVTQNFTKICYKMYLTTKMIRLRGKKIN